MKKLILASHAPGDKERIITMRKVNHTVIGPDVYALIQRVQMSEWDRHVAIEALRVGEGFAAAVVWVKEKFGSMGTWFLKPSVKH
jgi:hypothetical protein